MGSSSSISPATERDSGKEVDSLQGKGKEGLCRKGQ